MGISTGDELQLLLTMRKKFKNSEPACLKRKGGLLISIRIRFTMRNIGRILIGALQNVKP